MATLGLLHEIALDVRKMKPKNEFRIGPFNYNGQNITAGFCILSLKDDDLVNIVMIYDMGCIDLKIKNILVHREDLSDPKSLDNVKNELFNFFNHERDK